MRKALLFFIAAVMVAAMSVTRADKGPSTEPMQLQPMRLQIGMVPVGTLGIPIGQLVLLEGTRIDGNKYGDRTMKIEKINGKAVTSPMEISINNVHLPKNQRCVIRGYETMYMRGSPPAYEQLAKLKKQPPPPQPQMGWQVFCEFVALEAVEPQSLKIEKPDL